MITLTMFTTEKDLSKLTGLNNDQLCDAGFDMDDWDVGFCTDEPMTETMLTDKDEWMSGFNRVRNNCFWLIRQMHNYHCGYKHMEYNGKHYYMAYCP